MNFDALIIRDAAGERRFDPDSLPLRVGTGVDCQLRIPGPGSNAAVLIDQLDGQPFVQPAALSAAMTLNGEAVSASRRLNDGDQLEFYGTRIAVEIRKDTVALSVSLEDSAYVTRPPDDIGPGAGSAEQTIAPAAFRRVSDVKAVAEPRKLYIWQTAVALGVAVLIAISILLFTSRSIQFDVQPGEPDELQIAGGWFRLPLADRVLLRPGSYTVHVRKDGYYDANQSFVVGDEPSATVPIELRRLPGRLTIATEPAVEAVVTVNGKMVGPSPLGPLELEPGRHTVSVSADNHLPFAHEVDLPGLGLSHQLNVQLVPRWADVSLQTDPAGAVVYQGEEKLGTTPVTLPLNEGRHDLTVMLEGYKPWEGVITAVANEAQQLPLIKLEPANAQLLVNTIPLGANVTVNGRYRGQSPVRLALSPEIDYQGR